MAGIGAAGTAMVAEAVRIYVAVLLCALLFSGLLWRGNGTAVSPSQLPIHFYRNVVGELDGRSCPSYPVCSHYAGQAFEKHGMLRGSWLALDRLIHEGGDMKAGVWPVIEGERRLYDPLTRNDFWLHKEE